MLSATLPSFFKQLADKLCVFTRSVPLSVMPSPISTTSKIFLEHQDSTVVWWHMPIVPTLGRLRQEDSEFKASLGYNSETLSQKNKRFVLNTTFS
jgi:hypothetical protein